MKAVVTSRMPREQIANEFAKGKQPPGALGAPGSKWQLYRCNSLQGLKGHPFFPPYPCLLFQDPAKILLPSACKDRERKSEPKYTTRQSSNEPRKIPHITSQKKRRSLHPSSSANHRAGNRLTGRGWGEKSAGDGRRPVQQPSPHIYFQLGARTHTIVLYLGDSNSHAKEKSSALSSSPKSHLSC